MHNYLGREGVPPSELLATGRAEAIGYGGEIVTATVTSLERLPSTPTVVDGPGVPPQFRVGLDDGRVTTARRLLVTTGLVDELPDIPGLAGLWGHAVLHCPYCHG
ncbi:Putative thioredoxin-disulfide reductase [Parafrankia sp. Ea1.12]|nr:MULTISPECIES: hypothetical protein [unclassified Parafrankia]SQD93443.1 Putative thioredoxin-disulfide reductase [Parafrankia sp. Ea1.12]